MVENDHFVCPLCGKPVEGDQKFCTFCGASLSKQIKTENISVISPQLTISDQDRANLKQLILDKNKKEVVRFIKNLFKKSSSNSLFLRKIYDLIGEILIEHPEFFMEELYHRLYKKCIYRLGKILSPQQLVEMEEYILRKFCFYDGEQLIISSTGTLTLGVYRIYGNLYITNRRMIVNGILFKEGIGYTSYSTTAGIFLIILIYGLYIVIRGAVNPWKRILHTQINQTKPCFGYEFPFVDVKEVDRKKKKIKFKLKYEYDDKGENKTKIVKFQFIPARLIKKGLKYEDKTIYKERRDKFLSKFHEFLIQL